jgi:hypothetical protein
VISVIARWATWAKHNIGNFILVGRHFADPAQLPAGIPVQPAYGYDGQFFYRLALDPANLAQTGYGLRVDHSYRFTRIGYPALTWLLSAGQHALVPDALARRGQRALRRRAGLFRRHVRRGGRPERPVGGCWRPATSA